ncbi:hypothetical protein AYO20_01815 [Fonsecaea nubica]|uniref:Uncharacterized protein n=1 Tax=Fonsecaea nubica TaxID=856822 RepID=A0A178DCM1_9EURO|nr:hypothetical protein AYO20_01815 [Fonsecaea nubica]OAL39064.1 hypothetical protein AYO20_01815 [Fonsecaea nubica]
MLSPLSFLPKRHSKSKSRSKHQRADDDLEAARPASPTPSSSSSSSDTSETHPLFKTNPTAWTWKDSVKFYVWRAKARVMYAVESYRIKKSSRLADTAGVE